MPSYLARSVVVSLASSIACRVAAVGVFAEWVVLNYTWDNDHTYQNYISTQKFIPENCLLAGINVDITGDIYLTVPRWRNGIPATLNKLDIGTNTLTPFPAWDMQREGVNGDLQNVQSMTIDSNRRMWAIEVGRRNFFIKNPKVQVSGAAGLWEIDLKTATVVSKFYFPPEVVSYDSSFLNDIVIDEKKQIAYLTDAWGMGAIIAFDMNQRTSRRYSGPSTQPEASYNMIINGVNYGKMIFTTPTDGIALTDDHEALFYCEVQGTHLYRVPTSILSNFSSTNAEIDALVETIGTKEPSDGMKYHNGILYYGALTTSTVYAVAINSTSHPNMPTEAKALEPSVDTMHWVSRKLA